MAENKARRPIKLFCPSVAKTVSLFVWEEQRLDLGSIARTFGLDPPTLKLNGHFISRGLDLIASSVTWKSLLSFFSAKGLSTGENDSNPIVVDGKLCKVGTKRGHELHEVVDNRGRAAFEDDSLLIKSKKMRKSNPGTSTESNGRIGICSSKRKQLLEDVNLLKKLKISETNPDIQGRNKSQSSSISGAQLRCSYMRGKMKRKREDEAVVSAPYEEIM
ncbi:hypothetical protein PRUPE_8G200700 [Prunus persica]|uniref:Uncharacterized protein n=1 Tax=Prunus persica TaxID=3760 RepID=A0A251N0N1_PRUPE|nr:uncharacterized protein LOC18767194 [Prunus persica]ONH92863.1 hypothetical protein PRUPE_8G200700 [Prunus persica]